MDTLVNQLANFRFNVDDEETLQENQLPPAARKRFMNSKIMSADMPGDATDTAVDGPISSSERRRIMPIRSVRLTPLNKVQQHTICKKDVKLKLNPACSNLKPRQVLRLYAQQSLVQFQPAKLETIFEEPRQLKPKQQPRDIGSAKVKRAIACGNGLDITKSLHNKRRARVKKFFGRHAARRRIDLSDEQGMLKVMERLECDRQEPKQSADQLPEQVAEEKEC